MTLRRLKLKQEKRVRLEVCSANVIELSRVSPKSRKLNEKEMSGKAKSTFWSCWGRGIKPDKLSFRNIVVKLNACVIASAAKLGPNTKFKALKQRKCFNSFNPYPSNECINAPKLAAGSGLRRGKG